MTRAPAPRAAASARKPAAPAIGPSSHCILGHSVLARSASTTKPAEVGSSLSRSLRYILRYTKRTPLSIPYQEYTSVG
eukprot:2261747-Pyramimonas_sp.AAC.1